MAFAASVGAGVATDWSALSKRFSLGLLVR